MSTVDATVIRFGVFRFYPERRLLLEGDVPVQIRDRAMDLLQVLTSRPGTVWSRDELVSRVWPQTIVEETSLRVTVGLLRRALRDGVDGRRFIANVIGRGYSFVAAVETTPVIAAPSPVLTPPTSMPAMPSGPRRLIGRETAVRAVSDRLMAQRLVTIAGAGGIGKTAVALAVARDVATRLGARVVFVDLCNARDAHAVDTAVAAALPEADAGGGAVVMVLDTCEHVACAVAALCERLLSACIGLRVLATSREPLDAHGEHVHRLRGLLLPPRNAAIGPAEALTFGAIELFVERASSAASHFALSAESLGWVVEICHRLEGSPLALELASARVDALGVRGLAGRLDDALSLLTRGRRTAAERHRNLRACLAWSHDLLSETERTILRRLAILRGPFSLQRAAAIAACDRISASRATDVLLNLVAKSLVATDGSDPATFQLGLDVRLYATEQLHASGEADRVVAALAAADALAASSASPDRDREITRIHASPTLP